MQPICRPKLPREFEERRMEKPAKTKLTVYAVAVVLMAALPFLANAGPDPKSPGEEFFIHLHDQRAMANVTISAIQNGAVAIAIQLETVEELPLTADSVSVTLGSPEKGVGPVTSSATRTADDQWSVKMAASEPG